MTSSERSKSVAFHLLIFALMTASSFLFIFFEQAHFDSDQAISGLMAKHLSEGRHFPIFTYGAKYVLGFETWLAAPFMWLWGASVATLKLPLLLLNFVTVSLLILLLKREEKLSWGWIFISVLFFVFPSPIAASRFIHAAVGVPTSFLATLLVWHFWKKPISLGLLLGFVIPIRPFVLFAVFALCTVEWLEHALFTQANRQKLIKTLGVATALFILIKIWGSHGPNYKGPSVPAFVIKDPVTLLRSLWWLLSENLPTLFGLKPETLLDFNITSHLHSGSSLLYPVFDVSVLIFLARSIYMQRAVSKKVLLDHRFSTFLMLTGFFSAAIYTLFTRNGENIMLIRYTLLTVFLPIGFAAFYAKTETSAKFRTAFTCIIGIWFAQNLYDHGQLIREYYTETPTNSFRVLADGLQSEGIKYGKAPFWTAAHVTFLAREKVKLSERDFARIDEYVAEMEANPAGVVQIEEGACAAANRGLTIAKWCVVR